MTEIIETERLTLRPFQRGDLSHMQCYATRLALCRYLPVGEQTSETVAAILGVHISIQEIPLGVNFAFAVELKDAEHTVGSVWVWEAETENGSGDLGLHRIWAAIHVGNTPSWRLMGCVGM